MSPERTEWYSQKLLVEISPAELTNLLHETMKAIDYDISNPVGRDKLLHELVCSILKDCPP